MVIISTLTITLVFIMAANAHATTSTNIGVVISIIIMYATISIIVILTNRYVMAIEHTESRLSHASASLGPPETMDFQLETAQNSGNKQH